MRGIPLVIITFAAIGSVPTLAPALMQSFKCSAKNSGLNPSYVKMINLTKIPEPIIATIHTGTPAHFTSVHQKRPCSAVDGKMSASERDDSWLSTGTPEDASPYSCVFVLIEPLDHNPTFVEKDAERHVAPCPDSGTLRKVPNEGLILSCLAGFVFAVGWVKNYRP